MNPKTSPDTVRLVHIDAFTRTPFRGNPAGVVLDADGLSGRQMQDIARELRHSETAFVLKPHGPDHDLHIRYFTPSVEVPVCGHATIAAHYARACQLGLPATSLVQKTGAGLQRIDIQRHEGDYRIVMHQGPISFGDSFDAAQRQRVAQALGIGAADLEAHLPVQIVSTGHSKVLLPLRRDFELEALRPDADVLSAISRDIGCNGFYPFVIRDDASTEGRMFAPAIGIAEDPVTGNANGPLGAYIVRHGLLPHDGCRLAFDGHQGRALRRDGVVRVMVAIEDGEAVGVAIAGDAVQLFAVDLRVD
ncbi:PhzF family isomerase [Massilia sp. NR 4-1]|uniref:PhzF family isomerase n=1 Tax=Massilia sp. NR 4-1 TaxID=1678028 RepID=UPI00067B595B|nr:PhzF family isomerase [Massilia sp. NR 4-1]AKU21182.1 hypothetical protein ACZ75_06515 [Massilia sp. NR 4-1]